MAKLNKNLQGRVKIPTGGIAHEPKGMTWCNSKADSIVWMKEDKNPYCVEGAYIRLISLLWNV